MLNAVKAAWAVEKKTATDAMLKKVRDGAVRAREEWILTELLTDTKIRESAVEDDDVGQKRVEHGEVIEAMKSVISEVTALRSSCRVVK